MFMCNMRPSAGKIVYFQQTAGQFLSALKAESGLRNENVLLGFASGGNAGGKNRGAAHCRGSGAAHRAVCADGG